MCSCRIAIKLIGVGVIRTVVAYVTYVVTVFVFLKRIVFVRAVVLVVEFSILITVKNDRFADITFRSCRIVVQLVGVGVIGAVVANVTDVVAVFVFLKRVVFVRAVVLVIEFSILIAVKNDRFADITFRSGRIVIQLICIGVIRAVVASVTYIVTISVFLKRIVFVRAVVFVVEFSVTVAVYNGKFTDISDAVVVIVFLISVGMVRAVVASIADTVTVAVQLISIGFIGAIVKIIFYTVTVFIDLFRSACVRILVSVRVPRAAVACVADTVTVGIFLIGVVIVRAVIFEVFKSVTVGVDRFGSANYGILIVVGVERAVVACVADLVAIGIQLIRVRHIRAVVFRVFDIVAVRIYECGIACMGILVCVRMVGAVVTHIADLVAIGIKLVRIGNVGTVVFAVQDTVAVAVTGLRNVASAFSRFGFGEVVGAEIDNVAVGLFVVFVRFRFGFRFRFRLGFFVGDFCSAVVYDRIGKFLFLIVGNAFVAVVIVVLVVVAFVLGRFTAAAGNEKQCKNDRCENL